jgi:hypothetical protein
VSPRFFSRAIPVAGVVALALAVTTPAQAKAPPGWRIAKQFGPVGSTRIASVAAVSAGDAWAAGAGCGSPCGTPKLLVQRYAKGKWSGVGVPAGLTSPAVTVGSVLVAASSASDAWVFAQLDAATGNHTDALRRSGKGWKITKFPAFSQILTAADFGPRNAWAFGIAGKAGAPYDEHFNGKKWAHVKVAGNPEALSAVSAADVWALGPTIKTAGKPINKRSLILMHFDGKKWHTVALPKITLPAGDYQVTGSIAAISASNVFEAWSYGNAGSCCFFGGLEHWYGGKWHAVSVPLSPAPFVITGMAQDGHGGLWLADTPASGGRRFDHVNGGKWSDQLAPEFINATVIPGQIAWIPKTRSDWGAAFETGIFAGVTGTIGVIMKQGT